MVTRIMIYGFREFTQDAPVKRNVYTGLKTVYYDAPDNTQSIHS